MKLKTKRGKHFTKIIIFSFKKMKLFDFENTKAMRKKDSYKEFGFSYNDYLNEIKNNSVEKTKIIIFDDNLIDNKVYTACKFISEFETKTKSEKIMIIGGFILKNYDDIKSSLVMTVLSFSTERNILIKNLIEKLVNEGVKTMEEFVNIFVKTLIE